MTERLTMDLINSPAGYGHLFRYHLAMGFTSPDDVVLDAACGIGYASMILPSDVQYVGVDIFQNHEQPELIAPHQIIKADLNEWQVFFDVDVAISFETIEHVANYQNLLDQLKQANKWIIASVPVVDTTSFNEFHLHDFKPGDLVDLIQDDRWQHFQTVQQPSELSEISVFKNVNYNSL